MPAVSGAGKVGGESSATVAVYRFPGRYTQRMRDARPSVAPLAEQLDRLEEILEAQRLEWEALTTRLSPLLDLAESLAKRWTWIRPRT